MDINAICNYLETGVPFYEKTAPTVSRYLDDLYVRINSEPDNVRLSELLFVEQLRNRGEWTQPNHAANQTYKLKHRLGMDTTGDAGF